MNENKYKIKKIFVPLITMLVENSDVKVSDILESAQFMASIKAKRSASGLFLTDTGKKPVAIRCYYFERWMPLVGDKAVTFGIKKSTVTGFNTMCSIGANAWNARNTNIKKIQSDMMSTLADADKVNALKSVPDFVATQNALIEKTKAEIKPTKLGFKDKEGVIAYLKGMKVSLAMGDGYKA